MTLPVEINPHLLGSAAVSGYQIERSLRFNSADSAYLSRTPAGAGNRKTWTWSGWVKRSQITTARLDLFAAGAGTDDNTFFELQFGSTTTECIRVVGYNTVFLVTTQLFRDVSAWYHIVLAFDSTQATASNRIKLYVNGLEVTAFSTDNRSSITLDGDFGVNQAAIHTIGANPAPNFYFNGYLTEIHFIDGSALDPTSFGEFNEDTGVWQPIEYTGTYGTNGFYLNFSDNSTPDALGTDFSGNGNTWDDNGLSVTDGAGNDSLVDSPTRYGEDTGAGGEVRGNYATLNPVFKHAGWTTSVSTNGNLDNPKGTHTVATGTMAINGKIYWEITVGNPNQAVGIISSNPTYTGTYSYDDPSAKGLYCWTMAGYINGSGVVSSGGPISAFSGTATFMFAVDTSTNSMWVGKDGVWNGDPSAGTSAFWTNLSPSLNYVPWIHSAATTQENTASCNFGQRPFAYTAPSGFKALCTTNLTEPTIADGSQYFNPVLYTGTGADRSVTGVGFQPDFVWIKNRGDTSSHGLQDAVRGATKQLRSNSTAAEETLTEGVTSFDADGFSLGDNADGVSVNENTKSYVAWNWKAGGSVSANNNTDGTITSTVSVNPTAGFSIVSYTGNGTDGATVGHGLSQAPELMINKSRDSGAQSWYVFGYPNNTAFSADGSNLKLDTTAAIVNSTENEVSLDSSVITFVDSGQPNGSGDARIAYCFHSVDGFSKFGSYTGNGSTDGPFVFTNHRPAFLLIKATGLVESWYMVDNARNTYNVVNLELNPNSTGAEATYTVADFLSNGFKLRQTDPGVNQSGQTYIYMSFAENPFAYALAR